VFLISVTKQRDPETQQQSLLFQVTINRLLSHLVGIVLLYESVQMQAQVLILNFI